MPTSAAVVEQLYVEEHGARDLSWQDQAACAGANTEEFFADGRPAAENTCTACPVAEACREYAIARDWIYGIWGGTTKAERDRIRAGRSETRVPEVCVRGHDLNDENTYIAPSGGWKCRACALITKHRRAARRAA